MDVADTVVVEGVDDADLWTTAVLCNDADVDPDGDPVGDPTEVGLLRAAGDAGLDWRDIRENATREREVPFSSETKRMAVVVAERVHIKGAPEVLLDTERHGDLVAAADDMATRALRTLAFGRRPAPASGGDDDELFDDVEVIGVVGLQDPPRPAASEAVGALSRAGIRIVMITGDRSDTASAIAVEMGITNGSDVVTGSELEAMSSDDLREHARNTDVFARVAPEHKLRIVEALQDAGRGGRSHRRRGERCAGAEPGRRRCRHGLGHRRGP